VVTGRVVYGRAGERRRIHDRDGRQAPADRVYAVDENGLLGELRPIASSGATPYGFDFSPEGALVVTEAFGGAVGGAAASSCALGGEGVSPVSRSVGNTRSEVCWAAVTLPSLAVRRLCGA